MGSIGLPPLGGVHHMFITSALGDSPTVDMYDNNRVAFKNISEFRYTFGIPVQSSRSSLSTCSVANVAIPYRMWPIHERNNRLRVSVTITNMFAGPGNRDVADIHPVTTWDFEYRVPATGPNYNALELNPNDMFPELFPPVTYLGFPLTTQQGPLNNPIPYPTAIDLCTLNIHPQGFGVGPSNVPAQNWAFKVPTQFVLRDNLILTYFWWYHDDATDDIFLYETLLPDQATYDNTALGKQYCILNRQNAVVTYIVTHFRITEMRYNVVYNEDNFGACRWFNGTKEYVRNTQTMEAGSFVCALPFTTLSSIIRLNYITALLIQIQNLPVHSKMAVCNNTTTNTAVRYLENIVGIVPIVATNQSGFSIVGDLRTGLDVVLYGNSNVSDVVVRLLDDTGCGVIMTDGSWSLAVRIQTDPSRVATRLFNL